MKIALISPNTANLGDMAACLTAHSHQVFTAEGGKSRMRTLAEQASPDLMVVEGMCCDTEELALVEQVTTQHPGMAVALLCPTHTPDFLIHAMRAGVREVLPSPAQPSALLDMVNRVEQKARGAKHRARAKTLAFIPCKGGSGATFIATNLGWHLATSKSVLLIDLNLQFGTALAMIHDRRPERTVANVATDIHRLDASLLAASATQVAPNFSLLASPDDPAQAAEVQPSHVASILAVAQSSYDFVLLDMGRQLDPTAIQVFDRCDRLYPVVQQSIPALRNAAKMVSAFDALGYGTEKIEVLVNRYDKSSPLGLPEIRKMLGGAAVRAVPNSWREVHAAIEDGKALSTVARSNPVTRALAELAVSVKPPTVAAPTFLQRILKRA